MNDERPTYGGVSKQARVLWRVRVEPSVFRQHELFTLGFYRYRWWAFVRGWWYVKKHPHAKAYGTKAHHVTVRRPRQMGVS